jgi:hypothetical protein
MRAHAVLGHFVLGCLLAGLPAAAQTVPPLALPETAGAVRLPTTIQRNGDAQVVTAPGAPPTVVRPIDGGQVINRPGEPPLVCRNTVTGMVCN